MTMKIANGISESDMKSVELGRGTNRVSGSMFIEVFKPTKAETDVSEEKIPTTFEEKVDVYAKGEAEIQKLIKKAYADEEKRRSYLFCIKDLGLIKIDENKIRDDYAKKHPAYAAARAEMDAIMANHDKSMQSEMDAFEKENRYSDEPKEIVDAKRTLRRYEAEKQYKLNNPNYALLDKAIKYYQAQADNKNESIASIIKYDF